MAIKPPGALRARFSASSSIGPRPERPKYSALKPPIVGRRPPKHRELFELGWSFFVFPAHQQPQHRARPERPKYSALKPPIFVRRPPRHREEATEASGARLSASSNIEARPEVPKNLAVEPPFVTRRSPKHRELLRAGSSIGVRPEPLKNSAVESPIVWPPSALTATTTSSAQLALKTRLVEAAHPSDRGHRPTVSSSGTAADFDGEDMGRC
ncbi:hypothetical protein TYRP_005461 [Tyrophagus putrescentiae]|nr:hypothetical protein TYRP_005461 [Tyrophagus putrescentiae]